MDTLREQRDEALGEEPEEGEEDEQDGRNLWFNKQANSIDGIPGLGIIILRVSGDLQKHYICMHDI